EASAACATAGSKWCDWAAALLSSSTLVIAATPSKPTRQPRAMKPNWVFRDAIFAPLRCRGERDRPGSSAGRFGAGAFIPGHRSAGRPQLGAAGARVGPPLLVAGLHRLLRQRLPHGLVAEGGFHAPVLQRVKADDRHPPARPHTPRQHREQPV